MIFFLKHQPQPDFEAVFCIGSYTHLIKIFLVSSLYPSASSRLPIAIHKILSIWRDSSSQNTYPPSLKKKQKRVTNTFISRWRRPELIPPPRGKADTDVPGREFDFCSYRTWGCILDGRWSKDKNRSWIVPLREEYLGCIVSFGILHETKRKKSLNKRR